ncbi:MAG: hypothetical protein HN820_05115 [Candidatus Marinimicrobia bacterium]|nr:hypothetical protein [Candidatus Neomarinimicrobiota bacterium]MBT7377518.1 hypothetical protein [Candidatus Neomarinimicrobiota bacterium]|tara:strand:- start:6523 stop:6810 length:288 start_codon:yes stop_codon:yes gene_type:complete
MLQHKRLTIIVSIAVFLLLIPLISMQFTNEVNWTLSDFVVAGILVLGTGLMYELVLRNINQLKYRIAICGALQFALIMIWVELAVGIFGIPFGGN